MFRLLPTCTKFEAFPVKNVTVNKDLSMKFKKVLRYIRKR